MEETRATTPADAAPSALDIVRTRSLASLVAQEIEALILSGQRAAGERGRVSSAACSPAPSRSRSSR
jgi:hypothetical protein